MNADPIVIKRVFKLAKRELFDAWSKPEIMRRWFFASRDPSARCSVENDFTLQGQFRLVMHDGPHDHLITGHYVEIHRYSRIAFTWSSPVTTDSMVQLQFKALSPNRSELILTHSLLPDVERVKMHIQGWAACLDNLDSLDKRSASP